MSSEKIVYHGLNETLAALRRIDKSLPREIQMEMRTLAGEVATDAKDYAAILGLRDSGKLIRGIKPFYRGATAGIRSNAKRGSYAYPGVYEYGHGKTRAFLWPTVERDRPKIIDGMGDLLDRLTSENGFGRGGKL